MSFSELIAALDVLLVNTSYRLEVGVWRHNVVATKEHRGAIKWVLYVAPKSTGKSDNYTSSTPQGLLDQAKLKYGEDAKVEEIEKIGVV